MCNDCIHKGVCIHQEGCEKLQASTNYYQLEEIFSLEIRCKHYRKSVPTVKSSLHSYQMP